MTTPLAYVSFGSDYSKVHRLVQPVPTLMDAEGRKTACGRTYRRSPGGAGWYDYPHNRAGFCQRCRG